MTDKELLELAAKAANIPKRVVGVSAGTYALYPDSDGVEKFCVMSQWNPLTDDGDALRLAVKLRMHVSIFADAIGIGVPGGGYTETKWVDDANAATRRAITSAAAAIGEGMK